jgi:hypothetical protein
VTCPNRPQQDPRLVLRDLIAEKIHASDCGCKDFRPDGTDADDAYYRRHADAVMELFAFVTPREVCIRDDGTAWEPMQAEPTHVDFEVRTHPAPLRGED